jgi:hypothetical protein
MVRSVSAVFGFAFALLISGCASMDTAYNPPLPTPTVQSAIPATPSVLPPAQNQTANADETIEETPIVPPSAPQPNQPRLSSQAALPALLVTTPSDNTAQSLTSEPNAYYAGNCACPDDIDSAGRRCGLRSAYSKAGGASPTCNGKPALVYQAPPATGYGMISTVTGLPRTNYVHGYMRKNGTYVRPYYRSRRR